MAHQFDDKKANIKTLISALGAKEVDCRVRLTIHSVTNLPVLDGSFRVRWKFRDIDSKAAKQQRRDLDRKLSGTESEGANLGLSAALGIAASLASSSVASTVPSAANSAAIAQKNAAADLSTEERGFTPYKQLRVRDHTVTFEHSVEVIAHMRIVKGDLIGEPLKLVVERAIEESEIIGPNKKVEPRIGHKYIDLAEFVNEGKVRRKFLLERSKTNAMITVSLDIVTTKSGIEFNKPALRQDHLLIGRKEPIRPPTREKPSTRINASNASGNSLHPTLTRNSSTTSTASSAVSRGFSLSSRGLTPSKGETEAVIEALFNPSVFSSSPTPGSRLPSPVATPTATGLLGEAIAPKSKAGKDSKKTGCITSKKQDSIAEETPEPQTATSEKRESITHSTTSSESQHRPIVQKTILDVALDLNHQLDREKTIRPKLPSLMGGSWEFITFPNGVQGVNRRRTHNPANSRSETADSMATDFSTTSSRGHSSSNSVGSATKAFSGTNVDSSAGSIPGINVITGTPTTATPPEGSKAGRWYMPTRFKKRSTDVSSVSSRSRTPAPAERRATAPSTPVSQQFTPGHAKSRSAGREGEFGPRLDVPGKRGILGVVSFDDPSDLEQLAPGQLTPTLPKMTA